ncbi:MAG: trypsin-like peptidase domain-containing protein [Planctomycetes bacterium]|nr:trypsin-like peptidase domain-containing protein [Planctomycetota bacterium]
MVKSVFISVIVSALACAFACFGQPSSSSPLPTPSDETQTVDVLAVRRESVMRIEASLSGGVRSVGTAFIVDGTGKAVTNLHVLLGAVSAKAYLGESEREYEVEPLTLAPEYDLALVQLVSKAHKQPFQPIPIRSTRPRVGESVWSVGFPKSLGYTVNRGVVGGVRLAETLSKDLKLDLGYSPKSFWIQSDCTINSGNSGGPLMDSAGQVVGVNTWVYLKADSTYFSLSAEHLGSFISYQGKSIGFSSLSSMLRKAKISHSRVPWLEIAKTSKPDEVLRAARQFRDQSPCGTCKGTGTVSQRVQRGTRSQGAFEVPNYVNQTTTCKVCEGKQFAKGASIRFGCQLAEEVATLDPNHKASEKAREFVKELLGRLSVRELDLLGSVINSGMIESSSDAVVKIPTNVVFVATVSSELGLGSDGRAFVLRLPVSNRQVLCLDADLVNAAENDRVIAGGMLSGKFRLADGQLVDVIQGGFIVAGEK